MSTPSIPSVTVTAPAPSEPVTAAVPTPDPSTLPVFSGTPGVQRNPNWQQALQGWENALSNDLSSLTVASCQGINLSGCRIKADDAVLQAKYAVNGYITVGAANTYAQIAAANENGFRAELNAYLSTPGMSDPTGQGLAGGVQAIINDLGQVQSVLTTGSWQ